MPFKFYIIRYLIHLDVRNLSCMLQKKTLKNINTVRTLSSGGGRTVGLAALLLSSEAPDSEEQASSPSPQNSLRLSNAMKAAVAPPNEGRAAARLHGRPIRPSLSAVQPPPKNGLILPPEAKRQANGTEPRQCVQESITPLPTSRQFVYILHSPLPLLDR